MASTRLKKPCFKCDKGMGILTCDGCEQSFCAKHIIDHRQELSVEMDKIGQEYDLLRRDLICEDNEPSYPFLHDIDLWEQESIAKIQHIAQQARNDFQQCLNQNKNHIKNIFDKLTDEFQLNRQTENYTEIDFKLWIEQLAELRKAIEKIPIIETIHNNEILTPIYMIKIKEKNDIYFSRVSAQAITPEISNNPETETFNKFIGNTNFSGNSLVATHSGHPQRSTMVYITELYTSGIHEICFRIEKINDKYLFFGIINSLEQMNQTTFHSSSLYGWMAPDIRVIKSRKLLSPNTNIKFNDNDEILLTLNCNLQQIILEHKQTNTIDRIPIDIHVCPLPWRVVVTFFSQYDSVRIIS